MALIKSQVLTQASGSVGGLTYSHTKGGMYIRARAIPVNPATALQNQIRNAMSMYSAMWLNDLTAGQRDAWETYAANISVLNRLGDPIFLSGQNHYIRANVVREQANERLGTTLATMPLAPTVFTLPTLTPPSAEIDASTGEINITFDDAASWTAAAENAILVYMGRPRNATRKYFKGPYRLAGIIEGNAVPPASPFTLTLDADTIWSTVAAGQVSKMMYRLSNHTATDQPTGLSGPIYEDTTIVA
jgi:hypothetical protein